MLRLVCCSLLVGCRAVFVALFAVDCMLFIVVRLCIAVDCRLVCTDYGSLFVGSLLMFVDCCLLIVVC